MSNIILNTGAKLENQADGIIADAIDIAGGYFVISSLKDIPNYARVEKALCFCQADNKFYQCKVELDPDPAIEPKYSWIEPVNVGIRYLEDLSMGDWLNTEVVFDAGEVGSDSPVALVGSTTLQ